jgi:bifunctional non-homologous end joining protein LigD
VRPTPDARVSCPLAWDEVAEVEPRELRLDTVPDRLREHGDPAADIDEHAGSLAKLLDLARRDEEEGLGDAPWPPHFRKQKDEPKRVQPSRDRDRPKQPGRIGDPQPPGRGGRVPAAQGKGEDEHPRRRPGERTGQGYDEEFEDA